MSHITEVTLRVPAVTIGLDIGDRKSYLYAIDQAGQCVEERSVLTALDAITQEFAHRAPCRIVMEVGTHSPWLSMTLVQLGHEVFVANPSAMYGHQRRRKRNDRMDAEYLARLGRTDPTLLHAIRHRGAQAQKHLATLRARDALVSSRTKLINHVRGSLKSAGVRVRKCSAEAFTRRAREVIPADLAEALLPILATCDELTRQIRRYDARIVQLLETHYAQEGQRLQQVAGVGPVTALAVLLLIDDPHRFADSRDVAAYFGLVPRLDESSAQQPQLRITKSGDKLGRRLLVSAAQYILGPFGPDCDLRRFGEALMQRGGKNAKKRAVVAVARKLAVLLHVLWIHDRDYDPTRLSRQRAA